MDPLGFLHGGHFPQGRFVNLGHAAFVDADNPAITRENVERIYVMLSEDGRLFI